MSEENPPKWFEIELENSGDNWWDVTTAEHEDLWWELSDFEESDWWAFGDEEYVEGDWITGKSSTLPIEWYEIAVYIPVADDKEIVFTTVEPKTKEHHDGGYFSELSLKRDLDLLKLYGAERVDICLEETSNALEIPLFGAHEDSMIKAIYVVPEGNATGDNTDYMKLIVRNKKSGGDVCTKTYIEGNNIIAWKLDMAGPVSRVHGLIEYGESASLLIEKHGLGFTFPRSVIIVLWDYATDSDFAEAGL